MVQGLLKCCILSNPSSPRVFEATEFWLVGCGNQIVLLNFLMSCISCTTDNRFPGPKSKIRIARDRKYKINIKFRRVEIRGYEKS